MNDYGHDLLFGAVLTPATGGRNWRCTSRGSPTARGWTW